jgi:hypothetical protein
LRLPAGTLELLIEYRAYAAAYQVFRQTPSATGELVDVVKAIEFALVQEEIDAEQLHD